MELQNILLFVTLFVVLPIAICALFKWNADEEQKIIEKHSHKGVDIKRIK